VDRFGQAYVTGFTLSTDFPIKNPLQSQLGTLLITKICDSLKRDDGSDGRCDRNSDNEDPDKRE
jgi:hypothetical protein